MLETKSIMHKLNRRTRRSTAHIAKCIGAFVLGVLYLVGTAHAESRDEVVFFYNDALGSAVAAVDESGDLCWSETYTPYGDKTVNDDLVNRTGCGIVGEERGYTGHTEDVNTDLVYMQQRYYDPGIGRFLSIDPQGVNANDPRTYNRYAYANNNPYKYVDPDGENPLVVLAWAASPAGGATLAAAGEWALGILGVGLTGFAVHEATNAILNNASDDSDANDEKASDKSSGDVAKEIDLKQTGSYTNTHASGKKYVGKGSRQRSQISGRREAKRNDDPHVATDWTSAKSNREAFKQESLRLDAEGGPSSPSNFNRIEQPGKNYRQQDGEL